MGSPLGCLNSLVDLGPTLYLFGLCSIVFVVLNQVPQYRKILRSGSADGLSEASLGMGNVSSAFNVVNLVILHANQVPLCFADPPGTLIECQGSFLVLYSAVCGFLACLPFYFLKLNYTRDRARRRRLVVGAYLQGGVIAAASVPAFLSVSPGGDCEAYRDYGNVVGFLNTILLCCQYLPQIYTSYKHKGAGAVSYMTLGFDALGGYTMVGYKIYATEERLSSWLPYLVFHTSELCVIAVALYFDSKAKRAERKLTETILDVDCSPRSEGSSTHEALLQPRSPRVSMR
ncbi:hypothetical protein HOP50_11g64650 [Chloropicon primus]|uniref:Uncharacterized protein n=1 Tax=Chloropicon primus TaxID=1764295 RepID=A0A5B8MU81_9CHLO|nr:hypothetical protein A3770_11p64450 [Chloropicon primus]UPR03138.1 hypothetical protein HOP50_11g64650 [Chloropicon primus]|mmetsp:Transcript_8275/g.23662  ORF Transcript_8275/g.23662 Transcript_8275/m.23662 type:complete len:288 (+) Transcript_8275:68-931(+)|eukprot:QDZ23927.1 hypothetical protein A3770_11p64450 [Chloropicon primus]